LIKKNQISDVWLKASILGAVWAASEIILGSFLHNLRIPFNGHILTAIGLILMISASYLWKDKGLFWRAGLISALMKTLSPSAVIFGPMIAIFAEGVLFEFTTRVFGRNFVGFLIGASLAMTWILVQKIANFIIFYGMNIVEIYTALMEYAERQLKMQFDLVWAPILFLLVIYVIFGLIAVVIGMRIGKSVGKGNDVSLLDYEKNHWNFSTNDNRTVFPYSLVWLLINLVLLVVTLILINKADTPIMWLIAFGVVVGIIALWTKRYKRGLRQLSKPSFWIFFVIITMLSAFVITYVQGGKEQWVEGLIIGLKMNFRAAMVIVGFAVLGQELYNPKIRSFFAGTSFKQLPIAMELAFESLPFVVSHLPEIKTFFKHPDELVRRLMRHAEERFHEIKTKEYPPIFILSGAVAQGKTTFMENFIDLCKQKELEVTGFYSPRIMENEQTMGYDLVWIETGERFPFLRKQANPEKRNIGRFQVEKETLEWVQNHLDSEKVTDKQLVVIDEIGKWELKGEGWYSTLEHLVSQTQVPQLWIVRDQYVDDVITKWALENVEIFDLSETKTEDILRSVL
jgi:nucleoside-triphosphatase THEP1